MVPVGLGGDVQIDARLLPPVQIWSDREVALFRQFIAFDGITANSVLPGLKMISADPIPPIQINILERSMDFMRPSSCI